MVGSLSGCGCFVVLIRRIEAIVSMCFYSWGDFVDVICHT